MALWGASGDAGQAQFAVLTERRKSRGAEHTAGRITRPLRGNGGPYRGINVVMLWSAAMEKGYAAPIWMTFKQAQEFKAHVRKGEQGSLALFELKTDCRPATERTAAGRFQKPTVFAFMAARIDR